MGQGRQVNNDGGNVSRWAGAITLLILQMSKPRLGPTKLNGRTSPQSKEGKQDWGDPHPNTEKAESFLREGWAGPCRFWTREEGAALTQHPLPAGEETEAPKKAGMQQAGAAWPDSALLGWIPQPTWSRHLTKWAGWPEQSPPQTLQGNTTQGHGDKSSGSTRMTR